MKIFVTRQIPNAGLDLLKKQFSNAGDIEINTGAPLPPEELKQKVAGCDAILSLLTDKITPEILDAAGPQLKIVANYAVGFDNIDVPSCTQRKIVVSNTPGVLTEAVAEHAVALMMAVARRLLEADKFMRAGEYKYWEPLLLLGPQLKGKTVGIVGLGRIGTYVGQICAKGFDMKVLYYDPNKNEAFEKEYGAVYSALETLYMNSDFISVHVPLLPETKHLIDEKALNKMKPTAILVNTARGPVVDEVALVKALQNKTIAGAGLDVFENEPNMVEGLAELENVIVTPHIASATLEARTKMSELAAQSIIDVLVHNKMPENIVNKELSL